MIERSDFEDKEGGQTSPVACISVQGRKFLVEEAAIADVPAGVLRSLRVSVVDIESLNGGSDDLAVRRQLRGGFKKRVQGLIGIRNGVEEDRRLNRFVDDCRADRITSRRRQVSTNRRARKALSGRGLVNYGTACGEVVGVKTMMDN